MLAPLAGAPLAGDSCSCLNVLMDRILKFRGFSGAISWRFEQAQNCHKSY